MEGIPQAPTWEPGVDRLRTDHEYRDILQHNKILSIISKSTYNCPSADFCHPSPTSPSIDPGGGGLAQPGHDDRCSQVETPHPLVRSKHEV